MVTGIGGFTLELGVLVINSLALFVILSFL